MYSQPIGDAQSNCLEDILPAEANLHTPRVLSPIDQAIAAERAEQMQKALALLPEIQQQILTMAFGLAGEPSLSFAQISTDLGLPK